jgi:hypothetical protein
MLTKTWKKERTMTKQEVIDVLVGKINTANKPWSSNDVEKYSLAYAATIYEECLSLVKQLEEK